MSTISPITQTASDVAEPSRASVARAALTDNLDTFLTLLTKQLQNQDPLQPMDTNQFVDQLTQFSELEQGVEQGETLKEIAAKLGVSDRQADLNLLGRAVEVETKELALGPNGVAFNFEVTSPTENAEMRIFDEGGNLVARFDVKGDVGRYDAAWDGETLSGSPAAPGVYRAEVVATNAEGKERIAGRVLSGGLVREVRFEEGETKLILDGGVTVTPDQIKRVGIASEA